MQRPTPGGAVSLLLEQANEPPQPLRHVQPYHALKRAPRWFGKATTTCGGKEPSDLAREGCIYRGHLLIIYGEAVLGRPARQ